LKDQQTLDKAKIDMTLSLTRKGDKGCWLSEIRSDHFLGGSPFIDLVVTVAPTLSLGIKDGSGPIQMDDVSADIALTYGSASIHINPYQSLDQREPTSEFISPAAHVNGNYSDEHGFLF
jgi:hypothetical protein